MSSPSDEATKWRETREFWQVASVFQTGLFSETHRFSPGGGVDHACPKAASLSVAQEPSASSRKADGGAELVFVSELRCPHGLSPCLRQVRLLQGPPLWGCEAGKGRIGVFA